MVETRGEEETGITLPPIAAGLLVERCSCGLTEGNEVLFPSLIVDEGLLTQTAKGGLPALEGIVALVLLDSDSSEECGEVVYLSCPTCWWVVDVDMGASCLEETDGEATPFPSEFDTIGERQGVVESLCSRLT